MEVILTFSIFQLITLRIQMALLVPSEELILPYMMRMKIILVLL